MTDDKPPILRADARALPLADDSVDLIVTSPPYFGLRSYQDGGEHYDGQLGAEASPREFVAALIDCTREMVRVLKPTGSIFVNLGDAYYSGKGAPGKTSTDPKNAGRNARRAGRSALDAPNLGLPRKSLVLLPERYRVAAVDELGLTARAVIVWSKPNSLPESVVDRVRRSHEDWVHLTKEARYFSAVDEIREPSNPANLRPQDRRGEQSPKDTARRHARHGTVGHPGKPLAFNPLGKLPGSVWEIPTQPLRVPDHIEVDHFAAFPMEWPRRLIKGWCPREVCTECGEGRRPVAEKGEHRMAGHGGNYAATPNHRGRATREQAGHHGDGASSLRTIAERTITGYACACPDIAAPSTPGVVLDPFGGTGTTALVATMLGRRGLSVDLSADYGRLAAWRCSDPRERARAAGTDPSKAVVAAPGQEDLFAGLVTR